jgi:hypothetical protein
MSKDLSRAPLIVIQLSLDIFQEIPHDDVESSSIPIGEEDKNRFANVLPRKFCHLISVILHV